MRSPTATSMSPSSSFSSSTSIVASPLPPMSTNATSGPIATIVPWRVCPSLKRFALIEASNIAAKSSLESVTTRSLDHYLAFGIAGVNSEALDPSEYLTSSRCRRRFYGHPPPGSSIRAPQLSSRAGISAGRDRHAGAGHRRYDGHLQHAQCGSPEAAALSRGTGPLQHPHDADGRTRDDGDAVERRALTPERAQSVDRAGRRPAVE